MDLSSSLQPSDFGLQPKKTEFFMKNRITELLGTRYPLMLGPMRMITMGEMAAGVSNSGGFGQIAASGASAELLRKEISNA
jgi:enoyl-[acyl-carrier protein] reductase II